ncbi:MAG: amino acid adenylation domain-containing protein, partial [bacterium]|nr:amino acid adenylation domain-containing protein [bacterium]
TTLYMTLLAAFKVLLHRMTGQRDLSVGTPIANRTHPEIEPLIGFFVNTLVLRTDAPDLRFTELLGRVREVTLQAYAHQNLPFERLVEALEVERDPSRTPLFQVMFALQNAPAETFELPDLTIEPMTVETGTTPFDLTVSFNRESDGLHYPVAYNTDLFDETTIRRMAHHLARLLAGIAADPAGPLRDLPLMSESERHQLHREWNDDAASYPREASIPQRFEARVVQAPEAIALSFGDRSLSYRELDESADRLAYHLAGRGVGVETRVGVLVERSAEMVISFLAVVKAGGVYVPLDPSDPSARLARVLRAAGVALLLTQEALLDRQPAGEWQALSVEHLLRSAPEREVARSRAHRARAENLAYVMVTSGSTGQPKGVGVTHRAVMRLLFHTNYIRLRPSDRVAQLANVAFDAATFEIWGALVHGGCLVGVPRDAVLVPQALVAELQRREVRVIFLTTALFNQVISEDPAAFRTLRCVLFGGEAVNPERVRQALAKGAPQQLLHVYGPTETTTFASWHRVRRVPPGARTVAIGQPLSNTELHVVDAGFRSVPVGAPGELAIGGDGLARGYFHRPAATAERFVPHPFGRPGERLYRTGDQVRLRGDGTVEFLGRFDHQVKLRGFRIELGEIEAVLGRHPAVREAVVILRELEPCGEAIVDDKQLVAYVVPRGKEAPGAVAPSAGELRAFLRDTLPEFMVPGAFVIVMDLPLAPTGKVDRVALGRRALPAPGTPDGDAPDGPRTPVEEILAGIYRQVLGIGSVDVDDDFFALGGHSLRATQVAARVRKAFGVELSVGTVFEAPTVAELAACVVEAQRAGQTAKVPPLVARERQAASEGAGLPLSFAQQRLWFLNRMQPQSTAYNMPLALRLRGELEVDALRRVFEEVVRRHAVLRTIFVTREGEPRQIILPPPGEGSGARWQLPVTDLRHLPEARREIEMRRRAGAEARRPFDLARDPLLRTAILRLGPREHVLLLTVHHIAADGWSTGVLVGELGALYPVFAAGRRSPLPELEIEYVDFAQWQRQWFKGAVLEAELAYWRQQLAGVPVPALPTDRPRPPVQSSRGAHLEFALPARLSQGLEQLSLAEDATLFMTLLAAFKAWLHRITRQHDLSVGTPIANRTQAELEPLIGFFDNTLVLRTRLAAGAPWGGCRFTELLERVREVALQAYAHQNLPFERLVEALDVVRDPSRSPLFQVILALQNTPAGTLDLPGLALEPVIVETGTSTFDLTLSFSREPEGLTYLVEDNTDRFDGTTLRRMSRHLAHLFEGIVADPGRRLGDLPLLSEAERHQLRVEWNDRSAVRLREPSIATRFEAQVERRPEAVAVAFQGAQLSYRELNRRANRLAHHLRDLGVGPEARVGIAVRRSFEMVVGVLGVLKAGGSYVPLDPSHPAGRLAWQLEDAGASVVLVRSASTDPIPGTSARRVYLAGRAFEQRAGPPNGSRPPASTAYVLFTSGSTGRPKGVSVTHENLAHSTAARVGYYGEAGSLLLLPSLAFDASVGGLFWTLSSGGTLWLIPEEDQGDPAKLGSLIARGRISRLLCISSFYSALLGEVPPRDLASLRAVIVGGEKCAPELVARHRDLLPRTAFYNEYGLTETTVWSTVQRCESADGTVPIGRPIAGTQMLILDPYGNPVPIGVPGELSIGGSGVARGYLGRPQLTAERLAPNPFAEAPGSRLYRTGDLGRYRPEHAVEFLGRIDREVKIRGFRVEPGEIEAVLAEHPGLREAAVVAWDDGPGERRLVAYAVGR